jgi:hypothetical protein
MKIYQWFEQYEFETHALYDNDGVSADFLAATGLDPCWPTHTAEEITDWSGGACIEAEVPQDRFVASAVEIAEALAAKYAHEQWLRRSPGLGEGSRVKEAVAALKAADV